MAIDERLKRRRNRENPKETQDLYLQKWPAEDYPPGTIENLRRVRDHLPVPEHWLDRLCALGLLEWDALYQGPSIAGPSCALVEYGITAKGRKALEAK